MKKTIVITLVVLLVVFAIGVSANTSWLEHSKFLASDGTAGDCFGASVSISGDYCVVGAPWDDDNGDSSGSAYIFKRDGTNWIQQTKMTASDGAAGDYFGESVSISGDYCLIGARFDDENGYRSGSAYIFKRDGNSWIQEAKLTASDVAVEDRFGGSVSISDNYSVVGSYGDDDNGDSSGSAYIFKRNGTSWIQEAKLTASDGAAGDYFGLKVSISGDFCLVGAQWDDDNGSMSGSAYIFKRDGANWVEEAKLTASDGAAEDRFGGSVSISGNYCVVGAYLDDDNGSNSGSAYIFKRDGANWIKEAKLTASDGAENDWFSSSVSINGDYCHVGANGDDDNGVNSGSAYIFKRNGASWIQEAKLTASDGAVDDYFGCSVSINGNHCLVGAFKDDDNGTDSGSAYLFIKPGILVALEITGPEEVFQYSSEQYEATAYYDNGAKENVTTLVNWSVEPNTYASIDTNGVLTTYGTAGDMTIYAQYATLDANTIAHIIWIPNAVYVPGEYSTIQSAIDAVGDGNVVIVAPGLYTGDGNRDIDLGGKAITVRSTRGPENCVIDCGGLSDHRGFNFHSGEGPNSVLSGFTIKRGKIYGSNAKGGGIYCSGSSPTIHNCIITDNIVRGSLDNSASGGGVYIDSNGNPTIQNCVIMGNRSLGGDGSSDIGYPNSGRPSYGAGISCRIDASVTVNNCVISNNQAIGGDGGYSLVWGSNGGNAYGGGIFLGPNSVSTIVNCTITGNTVLGGLRGNDSFPGHDGYAYGAGINCHTDSTTTVENCIIWGDDGADEINRSGVAITYSDIEDSYAGTGNINAAPLFVTGTLGDYYLSQAAAGQAGNSPCVNAGSETAANLGMNIFTTRTDQIGDGGMVDMGYHYSMPNPADIDGDDDVDLADYAILASQWKQSPGIPSADIAPPGGNKIVDENDFALLVDQWLWQK